jgi:pyrroloquinoline quinone biosynthesis protein A
LREKEAPHFHENHERLFHDFAMPIRPRFRKICHVTADRLPAHQPQSAEQHTRRIDMKWEKPAASDMRFGFEITMYIANR